MRNRTARKRGSDSEYEAPGVSPLIATLQEIAGHLAERASTARRLCRNGSVAIIAASAAESIPRLWTFVYGRPGAVRPEQVVPALRPPLRGGIVPLDHSTRPSALSGCGAPRFRPPKHRKGPTRSGVPSDPPPDRRGGPERRAGPANEAGNADRLRKTVDFANVFGSLETAEPPLTTEYSPAVKPVRVVR